MAAGDKTTYTNEETIALVKNRAQSGHDSFRIKIFRRKGAMGFLEHIATADQARVVHAANPETWVPKLAGGGWYSLQVFPAEDPTLCIGGHITVNVQGEPRDVDTNVIRAPTWDGPGAIPFPEPVAPRDPFAGTPQIFMGSPATPPSHAAPQTNVPGGGVVGGPSFGADPGMLAYMKQQEERLDAIKRQLEEEKRAAQRALDEERRRLAEEKMRLDFEAKSKELDARIAALSAQKAEAPKGINITEIAAVIAPLVLQFIKSGEENRAMMFKAQQEGQQQFQTLMASLLGKKDMDPATQMLITTLTQMANRPPDEGMSRMIEAMSAVSGTSLSMMQTLAEIQLASAPPEHPGMMAVKEIAKALSAMGKAGMMKPKQAPIAPQPPRPAALPPHGQQPHAGPAPAPVHHFEPQAAFAGAPETPRQNSVDVLVGMIHAKADVKIVAARLVNMIKSGDRDLTEALRPHNNDIQQLAAALLTEWALADDSNGAYLGALLTELQTQGLAAGVFLSDDDGSDEGADESSDDSSKNDDQTEE